MAVGASALAVLDMLGSCVEQAAKIAATNRADAMWNRVMVSL